jgi:hypothetical protein
MIINKERAPAACRLMDKMIINKELTCKIKQLIKKSLIRKRAPQP